MEEYKFVTFDLYGTLVNTKGSLIQYFESMGKKDKAKALFNEWNAANFKNINSKRISFRESVVETLTPILRRENLLSEKNIELFFRHYSMLEPFPDTVRALKRLQEKYKLVIISNIDNDLVSKTRFGIDFDETITAEDAGHYYKPQKAIFVYALSVLDCTKEDILHVASSIRADVKGVVPLGWDMIFVNRDNLVIDDMELKPMLEVNDLNGLLDFLKVV